MKEKIVLINVDEDLLVADILKMLKELKSIDPLPTAENLFYWLQCVAEQQQIISEKDVFEAI